MTVALQPGDSYALDLIRDVRHRSARAARDVADWLGRLEVENKAARTLYAYERTVASLLRAYPDKALDEFTPDDLTHVLRSFPARSRHTPANQINLFFKWAELTGRIEKNPMRLAPRVRRPARKLKEIFTDAEITALSTLPEPDGTLMAILFGTGVRLSEACALQAKHAVIDLDDPRLSRLVVRDGKGGKDREIQIRALVGPVWRMVEGMQPNEYLWYTRPAGRAIRRTRRMTQGSFYLWWRRCLLEAEVVAGKRTVHSTRHTFATRWIRRGGPLEVLAMQLGHESIKTTYDEYVHLDSLDVYAALELVEG